MTITLTWSECFIAYVVGVLRDLWSRLFNHRRDFEAKSNAEGVGLNIEGAVAELVWAKATQIYWNFSVGAVLGSRRGQGGPPDVGRFHVRHTTYDDGKLLVMPYECQPTKFFALVVGKAPIFRAVGWITGEEILRHPEWLEPTKKGGNCYWVPQSALTATFVRDEFYAMWSRMLDNAEREADAEDDDAGSAAKEVA